MKDQQSLGEYYKTLKIIHFGLLLGTLIFLLIARFVLKYEGENQESEYMNYISVGIVLIGVFGSFLIRQVIIKKASLQHEIGAKLSTARVGYIVSWAMLETVSTLSIIIYILYGGIVHLIAALVGLLVLYLSAPKLRYLKEQLDI